MTGATLEAILGYWRNGGPLMLPIALVSVAVWYGFLRMRDRLVRVAAAAAGIAGRVESSLAGRTPDAALPAWQDADNPFASAVRAALAAGAGGGAPERAFAADESLTLTRLSRDLVVLAALTSAAPLLGLLGTVIGMIATFQAVAGGTGGAGDTGVAVSRGISQALITTQFGLVVAIPGVFGVARLRRLLDQIRVQFATCRGHLLLALRPGGA